MDLANRLLHELSDYDERLETFARMRIAVAADGDKELKELADSLVERHLLQQIELIIPDTEELDNAALDSCERRAEVIECLLASGHLNLKCEGLPNAICAWAAAQAFTRWGNVPWKRLAEVVLDDSPELRR